ncbi:hypothetical protein JTB14_037732 [Gonioctena quinquepunctata]|nr:hypothetical protein JTB14_037732 [Gonioctena quinquepunctata]
MAEENRVVILDRGYYTTCAVNLQGATITSWRIENEEQIFLSKLSNISYLSRTRGGMYIVFPHLGEWNFGREDGFARDVMWNLENGPVETENGDVFAELRSTNDVYTESSWNFQFSLLCRITLLEKELKIQMEVENTSEHFCFQFNYMHRCFFKVADIGKFKIRGLKNCKYYDISQPEPQELFEELRNAITISEHTDRVYTNSMANEIYMDMGDAERIIKLTKQNSPDMTISNPWKEQSKEMEDLDDEEYKSFVTVGVGTTDKIYMYPRSSWKSSITFEDTVENSSDINGKFQVESFEIRYLSTHNKLRTKLSNEELKINGTVISAQLTRSVLGDRNSKMNKRRGNRLIERGTQGQNNE